MDQVVVEAAHDVFHGVFGGAQHVVPGQGVGQSHVGPGIPVAAVLIGGGQVLGDEADGLQGEHLTHGVFLGVDDAFRRVVKGVHALVSRELRRDAHHQVAVHHREGREHGGEEDAGLFLDFVVGDD